MDSSIESIGYVADLKADYEKILSIQSKVQR